jgi:hypothetical protein
MKISERGGMDVLKRIFWAVVICFQLLILSVSASYALPLGPFARETVPVPPPGHINANNGFGWDYNYDIEFRDGALRIYTEIQFSLSGGVTQAQLDALKPVWESGIENTWNNKYYIVKDNTYSFPIIFDITYGGPTFNYTVTVRPGPAISNYITWDTQDTGLVVAHEFGHMVANFDEYSGGATNPAGELIDPTSIMTDTPHRGPDDTLYARHYEGFRSWLASKDPNEQFTLKPVPEPASILLLANGLGLLCLLRLRKACHRRK